MTHLSLPDVTLCAAASVNVAATVSALHRCLDQVEFADCLLFTDAKVDPLDLRSRISTVAIGRLGSAQAYSHFLLRDLADHIRTSHCLIVQWDGFVLRRDCWNPEFLSCDYIGAPWPQFSDAHVVGNGGFSLRSRRLLEACRDPDFLPSHPEDVAIARTNRDMLERKFGLRFADRALAEQFSFERTAPPGPTFGFHGIFNLVDALGPHQFWEVYCTLDDRTTVAVDYWRLLRELGKGPGAWPRRAKLTLDHLKTRFGGRLTRRRIE
jgi:hypothetical protein